MNRQTIRQLASKGNTATVRQQVLAILMDGKRHSTVTFPTANNDSLRGRLSELRSLGYAITHRNGVVQLLGIPA